jgi:hypothetical protein
VRRIPDKYGSSSLSTFFWFFSNKNVLFRGYIDLLSHTFFFGFSITHQTSKSALQIAERSTHSTQATCVRPIGLAPNAAPCPPCPPCPSLHCALKRWWLCLQRCHCTFVQFGLPQQQPTSMGHATTERDSFTLLPGRHGYGSTTDTQQRLSNPFERRW